jgi:hypothetical protein
MSFQAYLDNIQAKTGIDAAGFKALAEAKGFTQNGHLEPETKASAIVTWLKAEYDLGHGHAMAVYALLQGKKPDGETS